MTLRESFLSLVRLGIGHSVFQIPEVIDWRAIQALADEQGLSGIVLDGIEKLPSSSRPPQEFLLEWIGEVLQGYEYRYEEYEKTIAEMASFYYSHGFKMMVLKGYACSLNWPKPNHRPCGDIDIWLFGKQKEADAILAREKGIDIDTNHHHHTVFDWNGFVVENHYDFINVYHHRSNVELERIFKELGLNDSRFIEIKEASKGKVTNVYLPSPNLHALFLLKHLISHFASENINLRQILDWGFFAEKHTKEVDWKWLDRVLEKYGMKEMYGIINGICVEELGFDASIFSFVQFIPHIKDRVFNDVMNPEFAEKQPSWFLPRMIFRFRRWMANAWKHELCYNESLWSAFWSGVWNHLLKPSSI